MKIEVVSYTPKKRAKRHPTQKKRKKTKIDLCREWLLPYDYNPSNLRYTGLRGIYWYWLSRDVRKSEWEKWKTLCLTCLQPIASWEEGDCGHVIAARRCGEFLRFNRRNLTIQHKKCNNPRFSPMAAVFNALNYDKRYGIGAFEELLTLTKKEAKEPTQEEYRQLIKALPSYQDALKRVAM